GGCARADRVEDCLSMVATILATRAGKSAGKCVLGVSGVTSVIIRSSDLPDFLNQAMIKLAIAQSGDGEYLQTTLADVLQDAKNRCVVISTRSFDSVEGISADMKSKITWLDANQSLFSDIFKNGEHKPPITDSFFEVAE
ncbi:MAG: hypothetical protein AAGA30_14355, partial [Planctomycetota bacterium]